MSIETLGGTRFQTERLVKLSSPDFPNGFGDRWTSCNDIFDFESWWNNKRNQALLRTRAMLYGAIAIAPVEITCTNWVQQDDEQDSETDEREMLPWHTDPAQQLVILAQPQGNQRDEPTHVGPGKVVHKCLKATARVKARACSKKPVKFINANSRKTTSSYWAEYQRIINSGNVVEDKLLDRWEQMQEIDPSQTKYSWEQRWLELNRATLKRLNGKIYSHEWSTYKNGSILVIRTCEEHYKVNNRIVSHSPVLHARIHLSNLKQSGPPLFFRTF